MTPDEAQVKQEAYEKYRRARVIMTSFYQAVYGVQNVAAYSRPDLWSGDLLCGDILGRCQVILENLKNLEQKVRALTDEVPFVKDIELMEIKNV